MGGLHEGNRKWWSKGKRTGPHAQREMGVGEETGLFSLSSSSLFFFLFFEKYLEILISKENGKGRREISSRN